jgi:hypothetical protein
VSSIVAVKNATQARIMAKKQMVTDFLKDRCGPGGGGGRGLAFRGGAWGAGAGALLGSFLLLLYRGVSC